MHRAFILLKLLRSETPKEESIPMPRFGQMRSAPTQGLPATLPAMHQHQQEPPTTNSQPPNPNTEHQIDSMHINQFSLNITSRNASCDYDIRYCSMHEYYITITEIKGSRITMCSLIELDEFNLNENRIGVRMK